MSIHLSLLDSTNFPSMKSFTVGWGKKNTYTQNFVSLIALLLSLTFTKRKEFGLIMNVQLSTDVTTWKVIHDVLAYSVC